MLAAISFCVLRSRPPNTRSARNTRLHMSQPTCRSKAHTFVAAL